MATENQPEHINTYNKGADIDSNPELLFSQPGNGFYIDSRNADPSIDPNDVGAIKKIKGEVLLYSSTSAVGYKCIWSTAVRGDIVEFWAPVNPAFPGIVKVNGVIVLSSVLFELRVDYPLQGDINPSANFKEVAFTDKRTVPYILNVDDMVNSLSTDPNKYFSDFNPELYQINLQSPLDIPVFIELINVGGGGGLPVGQYSYQIRYASEDGDRTNWSQATPMIPVVQSLSSDSLQYPWTRTFGGPPNPSSVTSFAPRLRFRITNLYNYDFIEIKRTDLNAGAGIEFTPNGKIVAKIDITPGEISVRDYIDPSESNTNLAQSDDDETQQLAQIETAGSIRYFDKRIVLGDIKLASKDTSITFKQINAKEGFPIIDKLYKEGYNDPYNHVYKRKYMNGEKYSFGAVCHDGTGASGFVKPITQLQNYQFPNRRDLISTETSNYSLNGTVRAATTQVNSVGQTHEVFDHYDSTRKTDLCNFKNIIEKGRVLGLTGTRSTTKVKQDCDETNAEIENHGANVASSLVSVSYQPFHPVKQGDTNVSGHNYIVNTKIDQGHDIVTVEDADTKSYRPLCFAPNYYAMGTMVAGVENFPKWAKAFSIVRTEPAKRVVCQGLGYYKLTKGKFKALTDESLGGKEQNKVFFYSPDIDSGIVSSDMVNDMLDNPQNYKLQFVSPLGFFSEWYSAEDKASIVNGDRDRCIDMISYVRMLRDLESDANEQINPFEDANMGIPGADGYNYIRYDKFRNINQDPNVFGADPDKGNKVVGITGFNRVSEGRGNYLEIQFDQNIYGKASTGGNNESGFMDDGLKDWTEPVYIINIIRTGANVKDNNIQVYKQTTHYQKLESIIGKSTGLLNQRFLLVDERWDDCIPAPKSTQYGASTDRYIYIKKTDGTVEKWINVTYKTLAQKATIIAGINSNTLPGISGVYTHTNTDDRDRFFEIVFSEPTFIPPLDSLILVRYDDTAPIRVFGGDSFVGETIFSPIDSQASARDKAAETQFALGIGLPYRNFKINPRDYTIRKAGATVNAIQDSVWFTLGFVRQLCVMFTVESRVCCHYAHNAAYPNQYFPLIHYVIRPNRWDVDKSIVDNHVFEDYQDDYTASEKNEWKWGGFRFLQQRNPDYSIEPPGKFFSKPETGFTEITEFPTMVTWSLPRAVNAQDSPGLKTFAANSKFILDDNQGAITKIWSATTERGENLYAVCESGVCLLLTKKSILSDINSNEIGQMSSDKFIAAQYWLSREIGSPERLWRGMAEASISMQQESGSEVKQQALFFLSKIGVFRLMNNVIVDISRIGYYSKVYEQGLTGLVDTDLLTGTYNIKKQQYWLHMQTNLGVVNTFVFSQRNNQWIGTNDFRFERFTAYENEIYGHSDLKTYRLGVGYIINGSPVVFEVTTACAPQQMSDKEFIRIRLNGTDGIKPTRVEFRKTLTGPVQCALAQSIQGPLYMKNYRGAEAYVPRIDSSVDVNRPRFQQRLIIMKIIHNLASEFKIVDSSVQYKKII